MLKAKGLCQIIADRGCGLAGQLRRTGMWQNDRELVTTKASHDRLRTGSDQQPTRNFDQEQIADRMTKRVVDRLEPVEVEHCNGETAVARRMLLDRSIKRVQETTAIRKLGKRISLRHLLCFGFFLKRNRFSNSTPFTPCRDFDPGRYKLTNRQ